MPRSLLIPNAAVALTLMLACRDQPFSTEPASTVAPMLRTAQNPRGSGAFVVREQGLIAYGLWDDEWSFLVGLSLRELARLCETGEATYDPVTVFAVFRPDGSIRVKLRAKRPNVLVWDQPFIIDPCEAPPFASGTGQFIYTDNANTPGSGNRAITVGFRLQGRVISLAESQLYKLSAVGHAVDSPQRPLREEIEIRLTPIAR